MRTSTRRTDFFSFISTGAVSKVWFLNDNLFIYLIYQSRGDDSLTTSPTGSVEDLPMLSRKDDEEIPRMRKQSKKGGYTELGVSRDEPISKAADTSSENESEDEDMLKKAKTGSRASEVEIKGCEMTFLEVGI